MKKSNHNVDLNRKVAVELTVPFHAGGTNLTDFMKLPGIAHEVRQTDGAAILRVITDDAPFIRAKLAEFIAANPGAALSVNACVMDNFNHPVKMLVDSAFSFSIEPLSYNVKQAAQRLGVSYSYMKELVYLGRIRRKNGRISVAELERFLAARDRILNP